MAQTFSVYTDVPDVLNNGTMNVETASLLGLNTTLATGVSAGALSLTTAVSPGTPTTSPFQLWILDGQNSEAIQGCTITGTTITVPAPGVAFAHSAGVSLSSPGSAGCLASVIRDASARVETFCRQGPDAQDRSLWRISRTEVASGPSFGRTTLDRDGSLLIRPYRFPVTAVTSVTLKMLAQANTTIDTSSLQLPDAAKIILIPQASALGTPPPAVVAGNWPFFPRSVGYTVTVTYTGGPVPGTTLDAVPSDIRRACVFFIMDRLGFRKNPTGAAMVRLGDQTIEARLRGDTSGKSILALDAEEELKPYRREW